MNNKNRKVTVRLNEAEHEKIYAAAIQEGLCISEYIRRCLFRDSNKYSAYVSEEASSDKTDTTRIDDVKRNLIRLNAIIETFSDKSQNKTEMKDLVEKSWQSLR